MNYLLLFAILCISGALAGFIAGRCARHYSLATPINMIFGSLGAMPCLYLLSDTGAVADSLAIGSISLHIGCGVVGGTVLTLAAGLVHKTS